MAGSALAMEQRVGGHERARAKKGEREGGGGREGGREREGEKRTDEDIVKQALIAPTVPWVTISRDFDFHSFLPVQLHCERRLGGGVVNRARVKGVLRWWCIRMFRQIGLTALDALELNSPCMHGHITCTSRQHATNRTV
eukprot:COSAG05_NODE_7_length_42457_cov_58.929152_19_plen_140_part_00